MPQEATSHLKATSSGGIGGDEPPPMSMIQTHTTKTEQKESSSVMQKLHEPEKQKKEHPDAQTQVSDHSKALSLATIPSKKNSSEKEAHLISDWIQNILKAR